MPANSAITLVKFVSTSAIIRKNVVRNPNSSRIKSERPLPVTAPMREDISCVTINNSVMGMSVHNGR